MLSAMSCHLWVTLKEDLPSFPHMYTGIPVAQLFRAVLQCSALIWDPASKQTNTELDMIETNTGLKYTNKHTRQVLPHCL